MVRVSTSNSGDGLAATLPALPPVLAILLAGGLFGTWSCELPPNAVVGHKDGATGSDSAFEPDALVEPDAQNGNGECAPTPSTEQCATEWSSCEPVNFRSLERCYKLCSSMEPTGGVFRDEALFEACRSDFCSAPAEVDFAGEMVVWHCFLNPTQADAFDPEVWDCGSCIVVVPRYIGGADETPEWVSTLVAIPLSDATVQFADPLCVNCP